jgi:SAM-dependent methyltransferase
MKTEAVDGMVYPEDAWLKGYFLVTRSDSLKGTPVAGLWKNVDFLRLKDYILHLLAPGPGKVVLDVGCSDGAMMVYCGLQSATVYGQDLDCDSVAKANLAMARFDLRGEARCGDAAALQFADNHFDAAISADFFEHITDDVNVTVLKEIRRVLKPGGMLVIKTPNLLYLRLGLLLKRAVAVLRLRNPFDIVIPHTPGTSDPQHVGLTTRRALSHSLDSASFLNYEFFYPPLRRLGTSRLVEYLSTEMRGVRNYFCEDLVGRTFKPIIISHFPD